MHLLSCSDVTVHPPQCIFLVEQADELHALPTRPRGFLHPFDVGLLPVHHLTFDHLSFDLIYSFAFSAALRIRKCPDLMPDPQMRGQDDQDQMLQVVKIRMSQIASLGVMAIHLEGTSRFGFPSHWRLLTLIPRLMIPNQIRP